MLIKTNIMDGKIYDLLKKIDEIDIAKFALNKENRIFLKRLLIDEDFLSDFINKRGLQDSIEFFNIIYEKLYFIKLNIEKIKQENINNKDVSSFVNGIFGDELEKIEHEKEKLIIEFLNREIKSKKELGQKENIINNDNDEYKKILEKIKNNN